MKFGFLLFPGLEELDLVGPWEMMSVWHKFANGPECVMIAENLDPVVCAKGMILTPHTTFNECSPFDYLLIPGGEGTRKEIDNTVLINFIEWQAAQCKAVLSVCTGAFLLHKAHLLHGKRATTHWSSLSRLWALGDVTVIEERYVHDGNIWTAAGVSAGIDLALAFIASVAGEEIAGKVQAGAEYFPDGKKFGGFYKTPEAPGYVKN